MNPRRKKAQSLGRSWIAHTRAMRESIAWRMLPDNARRILDRLELEHMHQGGAANGRLKCTYTDFQHAGIRRASIPLALRQCVALGFLVITEKGRRSISDLRWPSTYRLTYVIGRGSDDIPTNNWERITSEELALERLAQARQQRNHESQRWKVSVSPCQPAL
jgi:hypothetical protein